MADLKNFGSNMFYPFRLLHVDVYVHIILEIWDLGTLRSGRNIKWLVAFAVIPAEAGIQDEGMWLFASMGINPLFIPQSWGIRKKK